MIDVQCICEIILVEKLNQRFDLVETLHRSFKNLRDVFVRKRKEYREALKKTSGAEAGVLEKYVSWPYYKALMFLEPSIDPGFVRNMFALVM